MDSDLKLVFHLQKDLMEKIPKDLSPEKTLQLIAGKGLIEETIEYLNSIGSKPWRPLPLPLEKQLEELVDMLHFYVELIILSGFTWDQITRGYLDKHKENLERYRRGAEGDYSWDDRISKREL